MNILRVHNFYGSSAPSGENQVFADEARMLASRGHVLRAYTRHSDEIRQQGAIGTLRGALTTPWNFSSSRAIRACLADFSADVVHAHNTFPLISPSVFSAVGHRAARVLTLHNYRLVCPAASPMRDGSVCTECIDQRSVFPAMRHGCYRNSRVATLPLAVNVALHRFLATWQKQVDAFIVLTEFQREQMVKAGLPVDRIFVKPNFYPGSPVMLPWSKRVRRVVFVGRLSEEKGVRALVRAWAEWGAAAPELCLVGDGPLRAELTAAAQGANVSFMGQVDSAMAQHLIAEACLLVLPSECFEGFPMVVREAFAFGTPVAVSRLGPLPGIVEAGVSGVLFEPANPVSLRQTLETLWQDDAALQRLAWGARAAFERLYNEEANYACLMSIYAQAQDHHRRIYASRGVR